MRKWNESIDFLFIDYINMKALLYLPDSLSINSTPLNGETMLSFVSISEIITTFPNYITWIIYSTKLPYWRVVIVRFLKNRQNLVIEITYYSCNFKALRGPKTQKLRRIRPPDPLQDPSCVGHARSLRSLACKTEFLSQKRWTN